jgi:chaperone required for assembly of F1-ATPase
MKRIIALALLSSYFPLLSHKNKYYQYQAGDVQITALLDGTNFMSPNLFKDISQQQVQQILKKYYADQEKGVQTSSMPSSSIQENLWY